jgi:hypothetical protein
MDSDNMFINPNFVNRNIWNCLYPVEYNSDDSWYSFIKSKDLGIICVDLLADEYTIVDEKKWLLSKLKYGF